MGIEKKFWSVTIKVLMLFAFFQTFIWSKHMTFINVMIAIALFGSLLQLYKMVCKVYLLQKWNIFAAVVFALINTLGKTEYYKGSLQYWCKGWDLEHIFLIVSAIGMMIVFYYVSISVFALLDEKIVLYTNLSSSFTYVWNTFIKKHVFWMSFFLIMIGWLPWLIVYYQGSINWDMHGQLAEFFHLSSLANHHPVFSTLIVGTFCLLGEKIGSYNVGIYLYILFQSFICASVYAYMVYYLNKLGCNKWICTITTLWFAFLPLWGGCAQFGDKDILFCAIFCIFLVQTYAFIWELKAEKNFREIFIYVFTGTVSCLMRNNVIYMVIVSIPFVILGVRKQKIRVFASNMLIICLVLWLVQVVYPVMGVVPASKAEAFSILFQQTARTVKEHKEELSDEQKEHIDNVLDFENIGLVYNPVLSDPVKKTYKLKNKKDNNLIKEYIKTWAELFVEYPITYIDATFGNSFAYYSFTPPIDDEHPAPSERFFNKIVGRAAYMEKFNFHYIFDEKLRTGLFDYSEYMRKNYFVGFFYQCAFYSWFYAIAILYLIKKKRIDKIGCVILPILTIGICCISPVNDCFRYFVTVSAFSPMLLGLGAAVKNVTVKQE